MREGYLPLGLTHNVGLDHDLVEGAVVRWSDVPADASDPFVRIRRKMKATFGTTPGE